MVVASSGPKSPAGKLALAVGALVIAALCAVGGLQETRLTCTRAACETVQSFPSSRTRRDLTDIRAVEIHQSTGKQRGVHVVSVIDSKGASLRIHSSGEAGAATFKRELEELLAGQREQVVAVTPPTYWILAFVALLVAFAGFEIREAIRGWGKYAPPKQPPPAAGARRPIVLWGALVVGVLVVALAGNYILERSLAGSTGKLQLECSQRCEFRGFTCLPGGRMDMRLDPGDYPIKVWNPDIAGSWESQTLRIELGQDTRFVCERGR